MFYQNSSVWLRPAGRSKPGSKPVQLYDRLRLQTTRLQADYVG